jgi:hypothetical protein
MPYNIFIVAYQAGPLGYLISFRKALSVLLVHKFRDSKLHWFVLKWAGALLTVLGASIFGFTLVPLLLAVGILAPIALLCAILLWLGAGDMFLGFALEDERFYNLATQSHALSVFEDMEFSLPQPSN